MGSLQITYEFHFGEGQTHAYVMEFNDDTMELVAQHLEPSPEWTRLGFHRCSHCPLDPQTTANCPIARNLSDVAENFKGDVSHHSAKVYVHTKERTYFKETDLQTGIQSIFGLIMATSGCPHMDFLKLMARYHLPFSSLDETMVRALSFYLLKQAAKETIGKSGDFKLKELTAKYEMVNKVNQGIILRLRSLGGGDADRNALVILDTFAQLLPMTVGSDLTELAEKILKFSEKT